MLKKYDAVITAESYTYQWFVSYTTHQLEKTKRHPH